MLNFIYNNNKGFISMPSYEELVDAILDEIDEKLDEEKVLLIYDHNNNLIENKEQYENYIQESNHLINLKIVKKSDIEKEKKEKEKKEKEEKEKKEKEEKEKNSFENINNNSKIDENNKSSEQKEKDNYSSGPILKLLIQKSQRTEEKNEVNDS